MPAFKSMALFGALALVAVPAAAHAQEIAVEGNVARAQGHWGGELGVEAVPIRTMTSAR